MGKADAETLTKALAYAVSLRADVPHVSRHKAAEEAAKRFDLGPLDEEWLLNQLTDNAAPG